LQPTHERCFRIGGEIHRSGFNTMRAVCATKRLWNTTRMPISRDNQLERAAPIQVVDTGSPTDDPRNPADGIALCLSGGGYRAMLFHLGSLWRLNERGYLPKLNRISSVSGGSITAGVLGFKWDRLTFLQIRGRVSC
jgi:predicted acylesterase/phospholipase RssA